MANNDDGVIPLEQITKIGHRRFDRNELVLWYKYNDFEIYQNGERAEYLVRHLPTGDINILSHYEVSRLKHDLGVQKIKDKYKK